MTDSAEMNIMIETGADFLLYKTIRDDQKNPVDLTGATIASHLREFAESADYFEFACMHNGQGGKITIIMPHETTSLIAFAKGVYDVKVVLADGFTTYTLHGDAFIREGVTKSYNGSILFTLGIDKYENLPEVGNLDRMYLVYEDQKLYRWNGMNYVSALESFELHNERAWDGSIAYDKFATVTNAGSSYLALHPVPADTDISNTDYWLKLAEAGGAENIDDTAWRGDTTKVWSANKNQEVIDEFTNHSYIETGNTNFAVFRCMKSWLDNNDKLYYGNSGNPDCFNRVNGVNYPVTEPREGTVVDGKYPLDCFSFVIMCLKGIGFEESIFGDRTNTVKYAKSDIPFYDDSYLKYRNYKNPNEKMSPLADNLSWVSLTTWEFAGYLLDHGMYHRVNITSISSDDLNLLRPGDVVFFGDTNMHPNYLDGIHHIGFYLGDVGYNRLGFMDCTGSTRTAGPIGLREFGNSDLSGSYKIVGYARIPCGDMISDVPQNILRSNCIFSNKERANQYNFPIYIDRNITPYFTAIVRYTYISDDNDASKDLPSLGFRYLNNENAYRSMNIYKISSSAEFKNKRRIKEVILCIDKETLDNTEILQGAQIECLAARSYSHDNNTNYEFNILEIIPLISDETTAIPSGAYLPPRQFASYQNAVSYYNSMIGAELSSFADAKGFVELNIGNSGYIKHAFRIAKTDESIYIVLLTCNRIGVKFYNNEYTYYTNESKADVDLYMSILS